jgi:hypothetical protein
MPIPYAERRRRRQQLSEQLPPALQGRIALRNLEAVTKLPPKAQQTLAGALDLGIGAPAAIRYLLENFDATLDEVIQKCRKTTYERDRKTKRRIETLTDTHDVAELAEILQFCFPDMPRITAEAMAGTELLSGVLGILRAERECFGSRHIESEFVVVALCGLMLKTLERINQILLERPIYRQALQQSGVEWPF